MLRNMCLHSCSKMLCDGCARLQNTHDGAPSVLHHAANLDNSFLLRTLLMHAVHSVCHQNDNANLEVLSTTSHKIMQPIKNLRSSHDGVSAQMCVRE